VNGVAYIGEPIAYKTYILNVGQGLCNLVCGYGCSRREIPNSLLTFLMLCDCGNQHSSTNEVYTQKSLQYLINRMKERANNEQKFIKDGKKSYTDYLEYSDPPEMKNFTDTYKGYIDIFTISHFDIDHYGLFLNCIYKNSKFVLNKEDWSSKKEAHSLECTDYYYYNWATPINCKNSTTFKYLHNSKRSVYSVGAILYDTKSSAKQIFHQRKHFNLCSTYRSNAKNEFELNITSFYDDNDDDCEFKVKISVQSNERFELNITQLSFEFLIIDGFKTILKVELQQQDKSLVLQKVSYLNKDDKKVIKLTNLTRIKLPVSYNSLYDLGMDIKNVLTQMYDIVFDSLEIKKLMDSDHMFSIKFQIGKFNFYDPAIESFIQIFPYRYTYEDMSGIIPLICNTAYGDLDTGILLIRFPAGPPPTDLNNIDYPGTFGLHDVYFPSVGQIHFPSFFVANHIAEQDKKIQLLRCEHLFIINPPEYILENEWRQIQVHAGDTGDASHKNLFSQIVTIEHGAYITLPGDATAHTMFWQTQNRHIDSSVMLCAPHHGSDSSSMGYIENQKNKFEVLKAYLVAINPQYHIICTQKGIKFGPTGLPNENYFNISFRNMKSETSISHTIYYFNRSARGKDKRYYESKFTKKNLFTTYGQVEINNKKSFAYFSFMLESSGYFHTYYSEDLSAPIKPKPALIVKPKPIPPKPFKFEHNGDSLWK
jgi:hypothetical protein